MKRFFLLLWFVVFSVIFWLFGSLSIQRGFSPVGVFAFVLALYYAYGFLQLILSAYRAEQSRRLRRQWQHWFGWLLLPMPLLAWRELLQMIDTGHCVLERSDGRSWVFRWLMNWLGEHIGCAGPALVWLLAGVAVMWFALSLLFSRKG